MTDSNTPLESAASSGGGELALAGYRHVPHAEDRAAHLARNPLRGVGEEKADSPMTPQFALAVWRKWWKTVLPVGLVLASIATTVVYMLFEPQYHAAALLQYEPHTPYLAFRPDELSCFRNAEPSARCAPRECRRRFLFRDL